MLKTLSDINIINLLKKRSLTIDGVKTTDFLALKSNEEVEKINVSERPKSNSDFALLNFAWQSEYNVASDGKQAGAYCLASPVSSDTTLYVASYGLLSHNYVYNKSYGVVSALSLDLTSLLSERSSFAPNFGIYQKTDRTGKVKHYIDIGLYPGAAVDVASQELLETLFVHNAIQATGRLYSVNGQHEYNADFLTEQVPEFIYNGQRYVRKISFINDTPKFSSGETVPKTGLPCWVKVEPVTCEVLNFDKLSRKINSNASILNRETVLDLEFDQSVLSNLPFYPNYNHTNCNKYQNSLIRAFMNSAKSSELDGDPALKSEYTWDFTGSGFIDIAFNPNREPTRVYEVNHREKEICANAFNGSRGLEKIIVHDDIKSIKEAAFANLLFTQIEFKLSDKRINIDEHAFDNSNTFKYIYLSKDLKTMTFSPYEDVELEKSCLKEIFNLENVNRFCKANYRVNYVNLKTWKAEKKIKFIPPEFTIDLFPSSEMYKYFVNNNNQRWGKLVKTLRFDTLEDTEKNNSLVDLMKIYYALGGFSENQGESETAYDYVLKHVATTRKAEATSSQIGAEIHARFSKLNIKGPYNPVFAKFFMKYYHDNPDFMNFRLTDKDGDLMESQDYLCLAHNCFETILKNYPNRVVNGNEERSLLTPRFVAVHSSIVEYDDVDDGNEKLAEIVGLYGYDQEQFEHIQEVYNEAKNIKDKYVICADKALGTRGITFRVLEKEDPLGFVLGDISNCCQHIGGVGAGCVDDGYKNPNAGFLVFEQSILDENGKPTDETRILGQAYIWYDPQTKTVCYDNIEIPTKVLNELRKGDRHGYELSSKNLLDVVVESADAIMTAMNKRGVEVQRVTTGKGYNDLKDELENRFGSPERNPIARHRSYSGYTDADDAQYLIRTYDQTTKAYGLVAREIIQDIDNDLKAMLNNQNEKVR